MGRALALICLGLICSGLSACAGNPDYSKTRPSLVQPGDVYILRSGGYCLGTCPAYDVAIFSDGQVVYRGLDNTAALGIRQGRITRNRFHALLKHMESSGFFEFPAGTECLTDFPTVRIEAVIDGVRRERTVDSGCHSEREALWPTVEAITRTAGVGRWARSDSRD